MTRTRIILLCALALFVAFVAYFPLTNTDIWWHLAAAREMLSRGAILRADPFAFTLDAARWIDIHWLFQLAAYGVHGIGGAFGLVAVKCVVFAAACVVLCVVFPGTRYTAVAAALCAVLMYEARYLVLARPVVVTVACMALYVWVLERYHAQGRARFLLVLAGVQIAWTNSQGLFALGPAIAGAYWAGDTLERWTRSLDRHEAVARWGPFDRALTVSLGLVIVACVVNPYGFQGAVFPLKLLGRIDPAHANIYARNVSENAPLLSLAGPDARYVYAMFAVTGLAFLSFALNRRAFRWAHVLLLIGFACLAYMAKRNILLYFTASVPVLAHNFASEGARATLARFGVLKHRGVRTAAMAVVCAVVILHAVSHARIVSRYPSGTAVSPFRVPVAAVDYLAKYPVSGHIFNSIRYGGYLIWRLYPEKKVFIDGRLIIRSPRFFAEYLAILENPYLFPGVAERFNITHVVLPTAIFERYFGLVKWLYNAPGWDLVFADGASVLFVREDLHEGEGLDLSRGADLRKVKDEIARQWGGDTAILEESVLYLDRLCLYLAGNECVILGLY
ncbi:MAG: hypothetical protein GF418_12920 [Chitinivibrionales bacterium]|nr:hypothetical protein [Chitinivibrionales bacterium]MBD3396521.1 hypothetical protein [Chitinivibrionales bacterium]